ncbi:FAD/NAD(P)-binding domain-containing protein [Amylocystis lapponica]|nr:FAD/NAD(P)-binding domain-containing protein [Amylocystis lapponica]
MPPKRRAEKPIKRGYARFSAYRVRDCGGAIAGLTSAIALCQVGHDVVLFDQNDDFEDTYLSGGARLPPNVSKIYYRWGLEERIKKLSVVTRTLMFANYNSGHVIGGQEWAEEIVSETGGEFLLMHYAELRRELYKFALELGAKIRSKEEVVDIRLHPERPSVVLKSGEVVEGDVIIGADGVDGITRKVMIDGGDSHRYVGKNMWNVIVPEDVMREDPSLARLLEPKAYNWYNRDYGVMGFPVGNQGRGLFTLFVYTPGPPDQDFTKVLCTSGTLVEALKGCEPRLKKLAQIASAIVLIPMVERPHLEDWVHPDGRLIVIGEGAHPEPAGSMYSLNMASGTRRFLFAVQEIRQKRITDVHRLSRDNLFAMGLPAGAEDKVITQKSSEIETMDKQQEQKRRMMQEFVEDIYAYDPEDEADNWWMQWGVLQERAARTVSVNFEVNETNNDRLSRSPP